ncbi:MAG: metallophosphoesterase [Candidatus Hodarchaeales archaeon]
MVHVCISDVHLGYEACHYSIFRKFIQEIQLNISNSDTKEKIQSFILLGDIFDFWRQNALDILVKSWDIIANLLSFDANTLFIVGNHDYHFKTAGIQTTIQLIRKMLGLRENFLIKDYMFFPTSKHQFFLIHGFQFEHLFSNYSYIALHDLAYPQARSIRHFFDNLLEIVRKNPTLDQFRDPETAREASENIPDYLFDYRLRIPDLFVTKHKDRMDEGALRRIKQEVETLSHPSNRSIWEKFKDFLGGIPSNDFWQSNYMILYGHTHEHYVSMLHANPGAWVGRSKSSITNRDRYLVIHDDRIEITLEQFSGNLKLD